MTRDDLIERLSIPPHPLKSRLSGLHVKQAQAARYVGKSLPLVNSWLNGVRSMPPDAEGKLTELCEALEAREGKSHDAM